MLSFIFLVAMDKDNQDAFTVLPHLGSIGSHDQCFFGIYDGHGRDGHHCARYARDKVRRLLCYIDDCLGGGNFVSKFVLLLPLLYL